MQAEVTDTRTLFTHYRQVKKSESGIHAERREKDPAVLS
ncbi:hypothetical protein FORC30_p145 (plasmid) [Salmonella enterica]|nr:hypothetical protein FORC30_p145 [Salmonella enterica]